jgi:hypothetical protein
MKPRIRELERRRWTVDFGDGRTATIRQGWDMARGEWEPVYHWVSARESTEGLFDDGGERDFGERDSFAEAFVSAWISVAVAPPALYFEPDEIEAMATECERGDAGDTAKMLRELLRQRTGLAWSCRAGRHRERFHVLVTAPKSKLVDGALSAADRVMLSSIFGCRTSRDGITIEPHRGCRSAAIWRAAGVQHEAAADAQQQEHES